MYLWYKTWYSSAVARKTKQWSLCHSECKLIEITVQFLYEAMHVRIPKVLPEGIQLWRFFFVCFFFMRGEKIQIALKEGHQSASETPFKWRFAGRPMMTKHWMLACDFFRGFGSVLLRNYIFVIFQGRGQTPCPPPPPPPLDPHMLCLGSIAMDRVISELVMKTQFYKGIKGKCPFYGHFPIIPSQNSMVKNLEAKTWPSYIQIHVIMKYFINMTKGLSSKVNNVMRKPTHIISIPGRHRPACTMVKSDLQHCSWLHRLTNIYTC